MSLTDDSLAADAVFLRVGLEVGVITVDEVIRWADSQIALRDRPPHELFELSLAGKANPHEVRSSLNEFSLGVAILPAIRRVLGRVHEQLLEHPERGPIFARGLYQLCIELGYHLPDDLAPMMGFEDRYDLARQGTYGTEEEVSHDFIEFTRPFRRAP